MKHILLVGLTSVSLLITACGGGGGGGGGSVVSTPQIDGIYDGQLTEQGVSGDLTGVISSNRNALFYSESAGRIYAGVIAQNSNNITSTLNVYDLIRQNSYSYVAGITTTSSFSGVVQARSSITGSAISAGVTANINLPYSTLSNTGASLTNVAQNFSGSDGSDFLNISISQAGLLVGNDSDGCSYTATVSVPNPAVNVYELTSVNIVCNGTTQLGSGFLVKDTSTSVVFGVYNNSSAAIAFLNSDR